jgi:hypothetical protein
VGGEDWPRGQTQGGDTKIQTGYQYGGCHGWLLGVMVSGSEMAGGSDAMGYSSTAIAHVSKNLGH